jgi:hypothetical protein
MGVPIIYKTATKAVYIYMENFVQVLTFAVIGTVLLWFGYTLFIGAGIHISAGGASRQRRKRKPPGESYPGAPQTCPVCSAKLAPGELVKSSAFPSLTGGTDRLMHIRGCVYCLNGERARMCPVCGAHLGENDILIARMFERPHRAHVHVLGCTRCRR